jgi:hypothetical protein
VPAVSCPNMTAKLIIEPNTKIMNDKRSILLSMALLQIPTKTALFEQL